MLLWRLELAKSFPDSFWSVVRIFCFGMASGRLSPMTIVGFRESQSVSHAELQK